MLFFYIAITFTVILYFYYDWTIPEFILYLFLAVGGFAVVPGLILGFSLPTDIMIDTYPLYKQRGGYLFISLDSRTLFYVCRIQDKYSQEEVSIGTNQGTNIKIIETEKGKYCVEVTKRIVKSRYAYLTIFRKLSSTMYRFYIPPNSIGLR